MAKGKIQQILESISAILKNKRTYKRFLLLLAVVAVLAWIVFGEQHCETQYFKCDSKPVKVHANDK